MDNCWSHATGKVGNCFEVAFSKRAIDHIPSAMGPPAFEIMAGKPGARMPLASGLPTILANENATVLARVLPPGRVPGAGSGRALSNRPAPKPSLSSSLIMNRPSSYAAARSSLRLRLASRLRPGVDAANMARRQRSDSCSLKAKSSNSNFCRTTRFAFPIPHAKRDPA